MRLLRYVLLFAVLAAAAAGLAYVLAGRAAPPLIAIDRPAKLLGRQGTLELTVETPGARLSGLDIVMEQGDRRFPLFQIERLDAGGAHPAVVTQETEDRVRLTMPIGRSALPELRDGPARLRVTARRGVLYGLRTLEASLVRDLDVRLTPPRLQILSTHHYINHGGSELVVYRVDPSSAASGVQVGDLRYPGYPAPGAAGDGGLRVAFFALPYDQDLATPIELAAIDEAGNETRTPFEHRVFPKAFRRSRIELDRPFMQRVVSEIGERAGALPVPVVADADSLLRAFLYVNGDLRRANAAAIRNLAAQTQTVMLWSGPFQQLGNSQVESAFADHRTYFYEGREVDRQVHLGFDLAVTANVPVAAANAGRVVFADYLGIYGNTVVIDHGLGVQSLYGHLSSIGVRQGQQVQKGEEIGRSGMTGLAGGDHLHFTMLVNGHMVNPVEWWDPHWIEDRIVRKLREAGVGFSAFAVHPALCY